MRRSLIVVAVLSLPVLVLAACGGEDTGAAGGAGSTDVAVSLADFSITPDVTSLPAGSVTFAIENDGTQEHEMVVIRTDLDAAVVPVEGDQAEEESPGLQPMGEVEDLEPGDSSDLTLTLDPGRYLLICNYPGHFQKGMWSVIQVG